MSAEDFLYVGEAIRTPDAAVALYKENGGRFMPVTWSAKLDWREELIHVISGQIRSLNSKFTSTDKADAVWNNAKPFTAENGAQHYTGNCNDWACMLLKRLLDMKMPRGALSLALGKRERIGHMVLVIRTDRGDLVADNILGLVELTSPRLRLHKIEYMENGPYWVRTTKPPTLADLLKGQRTA